MSTQLSTELHSHPMITDKPTIFLLGCNSFVVAADDNPDCVPFYRAWRGMQFVLGKETLDRWHHLFHEAICWGTNEKAIEKQYEKIVASAKRMCERGERTEEPRYSYGWDCPPSEPTETDARKFFNSEYKIAFPSKRANSKHANQLWEENKQKALHILHETYKLQLAQYETRERERNAENTRRREEWINQAWSMAEFENIVRSL